MTNTNARRGRRVILSNNIQPGSIDMQNAKLTCTPVLARGSRPARKRRIGCGKIKANL
jgi:hypothetical protein